MSPDERPSRTVYRLQRKLPVTFDGVTAEVKVAELQIERTGASERVVLVATTPAQAEGGMHPLVQALNGFTGNSMPFTLIHFAEGDVKALLKCVVRPGRPILLHLLMLMVAGGDVASDRAEWETDLPGGSAVTIVRPKPGLPEVELAATVTRPIGT